MCVSAGGGMRSEETHLINSVSMPACAAVYV